MSAALGISNRFDCAQLQHFIALSRDHSTILIGACLIWQRKFNYSRLDFHQTLIYWLEKSIRCHCQLVGAPMIAIHQSKLTWLLFKALRVFTNCETASAHVARQVCTNWGGNQRENQQIARLFILAILLKGEIFERLKRRNCQPTMTK